MPNERRYSNELNLESVGINLPYNMQAEQSVLGAVLLKPETLTDLVEIIRPEMFYTRQNAQIYSEMLRLFTADQTIDFVTLLDAVISDGVFPSADEAKVYLTGLAETVPSISNVKAYAQIVQEKYLVRQLMGVAKDILQDAGDEPDADLLLENAEQRIYEIRSGRDSSALTPLSSSMVETLTNLQKISGPDADKYKGIPTGFRLLDTVLTGLGRGDLIILAARPGMGKTSFALNIATRVAMQQKVPVAIFSLEMTKEQLTNRILSSEAGIDSQAFRTGALRAEDWEYLALATEKLHVLQAQLLGNLEVHSACRCIHVGMHGDDGNIILDRLANGALHIVLIRYPGKLSEDERMMAYDEIAALLDRLFYHRLSDVKTQQCP